MDWWEMRGRNGLVGDEREEWSGGDEREEWAGR